jgi:hypothetical protein
MPSVNLLAVVVAAVAAFVVGGLWYSPMLFGKTYMQLRGLGPGAAKMPVGEIVGEFARNLVVAYVLARFVALLGVNTLTGALQLGLWVWVGFQAMLLIGAVLHEKLPWKLYAIHVSDALVKTLLMSAILGVWR